MLTKDLLAFKREKNRLKPSFIEVNDWRYLKVAEQLLSIYNNSQGISRSEIEEQVSLVVNATRNAKVAKGLNKICLDRTEFSKPGDYDYPEMRKKLFLTSAQLIKSPSSKTADYHDFQLEVFRQTAEIEEFVQSSIYGDLPQNEELISFKPISPEHLLQRYNCALVQSLLFYASSMEVELTKPDAQKLRRLFKYLKFFRLLAEIKCSGLTKKNSESPTKVHIKIDGPVSLFENTSKYGLQLASFFPAIPDLEEWKIVAELKIDNNHFQLHVDQKSLLVSHYRHFSSYVPEEIKIFHSTFKEKSTEWQIIGQTPFIPVGGGEVIFPDLSFQKGDGEIIHLELFHRWHMGQLIKRIEQINELGLENLIIGIDRSLLNKGGLEESLEATSWFGQRGFYFRDFPGVNAILKTLANSSG